MTEKMNMSLDEIISSHRGSFSTQQQRHPNRRNNGITIMRRGGNSPYNRGQQRNNIYGVRNIGARYARIAAGGIQKPSLYARDEMQNGFGAREYDGYKRLFNGGPTVNHERTALLVSNLDFGVSDSDIRELFSDFGSLVKAAVHYDRSGRSLGTADVVYERAADAVKAVKQYNGVPLDGRPMNIQYATSQLPQSTLSTYNNIPYRTYGYRPSAGRGSGIRRTQVRGGGGTRGASQNQRGGRSEPTAEELDAELDAYVNKMKI